MKLSFTSFAFTALLAALITSGALVLTGYPANAQDTSTSQQTQNIEHKEQTLEAFVISATKIRDIQSKWVPKLQNTEDPSKMNEMRKKVQGEMISAIQSTENISVDQFQQISQQFKQDKTLAQRIQNIAENMSQ